MSCRGVCTPELLRRRSAGWTSGTCPSDFTLADSLEIRGVSRGRTAPLFRLCHAIRPALCG